MNEEHQERKAGEKAKKVKKAWERKCEKPQDIYRLNVI